MADTTDTKPPTPPAPLPPSAPPGTGGKWRAAAGTYLRAVLAAALTAVLAVFTSTGHFPADGKEWLAVSWSVVIAVLPVVINALNPADPRYGRGSQQA
jgi:hypothetical protein